MGYSYYELKRVDVEDPKPGEFRLRTAAVLSCSLCGSPISGMGGPGDGDVCIPCGGLLKQGKLRTVITWEPDPANPKEKE